MAEINVIQEMDELKKVLSYSKKIGFFFGAGSSCAFGLPNVKTLTQMVEKNLEGDMNVIFNILNNILKDLLKKTDITVEDILNYVRQIREITGERRDKIYEEISGDKAKELDENICKSIFNIIKECEKKADISALRKFFAWLDMTNRSYTKEVFTTNYDMLLEKAMEANYIPYFDGFVGAYEPFFWPESIEKFVTLTDMTNNWIRLWKIHGSLNWRCVEDKYRDALKIVRTAKLDNPDNELLIYPSKEKYNLSRKQPYIAYFDRLKNYMLQGELILIFSGYSFCDQHINDIIFNCLRQNTRLYAIVLCFSDEQVETMKEYGQSYLNLCVLGPKKAIINGTYSDWKYDESGGNVDSTTELYWDKVKEQFVLGDFIKMVDFLITNSGNGSVIEEALHEK